MAQSSTYSSAIHTARTDLVLAARFELAAYVNVNKPDSRQNANPRPRHPDARRDETATLTAAALTALIEVKQICLQSTKGSERQCMAEGGVYLSSHSRLTMPCCQSLLNERSSRSVSDPRAGRESQPAGLAAAAMTWRGRCTGHIDLCGTDPGLLCAATQRHPNDIASWLLRCEAIAIKSFVTHE